MNIEEDIKNLKTYIELVIEKNYCDCNELNTICYGKYGDGSKNVAKSIENVLTAYEKEKEKNKEYENMIINHKKQLKQSGIYGYDYDLEILEEE